MTNSFTQVFGGQALFPDNPTYVTMTISADASLAWPVEQQISGDRIFASIIDITATVAGLTVFLPDARTSGQGNAALFNNKGSETVIIADISGGTVLSLAPGLQWFVYLSDNSTEDGVWTAYQLGATVSVANAAALAGAGLTSDGNTLNQSMPVTSTAMDTVLSTVDLARATIWIGGVGIFTLPDAGVVGNAWFTIIKNLGSGNVTLLATGGQLVDTASSVIVAPGQSCFVGCDGTQFFTVGLSASAGIAGFDFTSLNVAGAGDYVLTGAALNRIAYRATGLMTGDRKIVVPNTVQQYWIDNETTGAFVLSIGTSTQAPGVIVAPGQRVITYSDGTDVISASSSALVFPVLVSQGGTGATTAVGALANLGGVPLTRTLFAGNGLTGGGNLTADRTLVVDGTKVALLANSNIFTGANQTIQAASPIQTLIDTSGAVDNQIWDVTASAGLLDFRAWNDAKTISTPWLRVDRTGTTIGAIRLGAPLQLNLGSVAAPSIYFIGDATTGIYGLGSNHIGFSAGGVLQAVTNNQGLGIVPNGSATDPSLYFTSTQEGFFSAPGVIGMSIDDVECFRFNNSTEALKMTTTRARGTGGFYQAWYDPTGIKGYLGYGSLGIDTFFLVNGVGSISLLPNGVEALTFKGAPTTGSGAVTSLAANKPGGGNNIVLWVPVSYNGVNYYLPLYGS